MRAFLITSLLMFTVPTGEAEEMLSFLTSSINGEKYTHEYPLAKVRKLPEWDMKGDTPIRFAEAVKNAWEYVRKSHPDQKITLEDVELDARGYPVGVPARHKKICWVYRFEFRTMGDTMDIHKIVMLMDGTIITPRPVEP